MTCTFTVGSDIRPSISDYESLSFMLSIAVFEADVVGENSSFIFTVCVKSVLSFPM